MNASRAALLAAAVAAAPAPAHAESIAYDPYARPSRPEDPWKRTRFEGAIGALIGGQRVGWVSGFAGGLHLDAGVRRDRLMIYGEYDFLGVGASSTTGEEQGPRGHMHRLGASVRYSVGAVGGGRHDPVRGDFWVEGGIGHQHVRWHEGGILRRRDLSLGLGAQTTFKIGRERPRFVGIHYAVKAFVARAPSAKDTPPTCAGPCDEPTGPMPYDLGIFFNFAVPFGR